MTYVDPSGDLPWYMRQGGPGPTGGPSAAPQGGGPPGSGGMGWLNYLSQMFGVSPQQAATMAQNMPSADAQNMSMAAPGVGGAFRIPGNPAMQNANVQVLSDDNPHGDGPPPPPAPVVGPISRGGPIPITDNSGPSILPQARGQANPPFPPAAGASILPQARGAAVPPDPSQPSILPQARGVAVPPGPMAPGAAILQPGAAQAVNPAATGGAGGQGATSNPRFVGIAAPNFSPQNSMRGGPQGTALNLSGLFGGQPAAAAANAPAASARPMSGRLKGPLAAPSGDDWDIDANGNVVPNYGPLDRTTKAPSAYGPLQRGRTWGYKGGIPT